MSNFDHIWNEQQVEEAAKEGWLLALVVNEGKPVQTAYLDIFDEGPRFKHRGVAVKFVIDQAQRRSKLHMDAIAACAASKLEAAHRTAAAPRKRR